MVHTQQLTSTLQKESKTTPGMSMKCRYAGGGPCWLQHEIAEQFSCHSHSINHNHKVYFQIVAKLSQDKSYQYVFAERLVRV